MAVLLVDALCDLLVDDLPFNTQQVSVRCEFLLNGLVVVYLFLEDLLGFFSCVPACKQRVETFSWRISLIITRVLLRLDLHRHNCHLEV